MRRCSAASVRESEQSRAAEEADKAGFICPAQKHHTCTKWFMSGIIFADAKIAKTTIFPPIKWRIQAVPTILRLVVKSLKLSIVREENDMDITTYENMVLILHAIRIHFLGNSNYRPK